jgi:hypothetical protein
MTLASAVMYVDLWLADGGSTPLTSYTSLERCAWLLLVLTRRLKFLRLLLRLTEPRRTCARVHFSNDEL